ncbi:MAG: HAD-IA family hydrolase [Kangiellaceae bacterium]|nr:HAD-IA family hydrolase [Kangiellaceae bacterium]
MTSNINHINWQQIKVISFDLDDTLWDNSGVIERCNQKLYDFLCDKHEPIKHHFTVQSMQRLSDQLIATEQEHLENMTVLRKHVIEHMLQETAGDLALVNPAFAVFYHWRNHIDIPNISIDLLGKLQKKYTLYAVSNGNSNLYQLNIRHYFKKHFIAGIDGRAKPSPEMLNKVCQLEQIEPQQLLHIGDSFETDIQSSIAASCQHLEIHVSDIENLINVI